MADSHEVNSVRTADSTPQPLAGTFPICFLVRNALSAAFPDCPCAAPSFRLSFDLLDVVAVFPAVTGVSLCLSTASTRVCIVKQPEAKSPNFKINYETSDLRLPAVCITFAVPNLIISIMQFSKEIRDRIEAATRNFACPICGNQQIYLSSELSVKPYYKFGADRPSELVNTIAAHCTCCGFIMEFNLDTLVKGNDPR